MKTSQNSSPIDQILSHLAHYLPSQAPLKDFIHHNTLHAFQDEDFHSGIQRASRLFGTQVYLPVAEYRELYVQKKIAPDLLEKEILAAGMEEPHFLENMLTKHYDTQIHRRMGQLRQAWKTHYDVSMDEKIHPILFRLFCGFLDQGIALWRFPNSEKTFLEALRCLDDNPWSTVFLSRNSRARKLLKNPDLKMEELLQILVGNEALYETYLFDQQFSHPGWSGLISTIEAQPQSLLDSRKITLREAILFELLLEIDFLDYAHGKNWKPLGELENLPTEPLFSPVKETETETVQRLFHNAFEATYQRSVLKLLSTHPSPARQEAPLEKLDFQAVFCIDDRECSFRRHIETVHPNVETFGTPGFFGVEFFYQPEQGRFFTKLCPAPVTPKHLIKQWGSGQLRKKDYHFHAPSHSFFRGWFVTQSLGYWSALKLFLNIFKPTFSPATATSLRHMDRVSSLTIDNDPSWEHEAGLQIGFTVDEMVARVSQLFLSIGLKKRFAPLVYFVGHGSSSVNNPHYSAYDCGACSGRPGSVNARVVAHMANHPEVRRLLAKKGIVIPDSTRFIGALHDTTRDEMEFFDDERVSPELAKIHEQASDVFEKALDANARERSRRFDLLNSDLPAPILRDKIKLRSVSLFEPRPELNHATNALCIIAPRHTTRGRFLDRRAFLNSYDPELDPDGEILTRLLGAAAPVCGGINLEYYFSRVDNQKLGAGTKLPHNVMGLIGVANGIEGDLRPGLPSQMIEVHDPLRLFILVEQEPSVALAAVQRNPVTYEWFKNNWIHYGCIDPQSRKIFRLVGERMIPQEIAQ